MEVIRFNLPAQPGPFEPVAQEFLCAVCGLEPAEFNV